MNDSLDAEAALGTGHRLVATVRTPGQFAARMGATATACAASHSTSPTQRRPAARSSTLSRRLAGSSRS